MTTKNEFDICFRPKVKLWQEKFHWVERLGEFTQPNPLSQLRPHCPFQHTLSTLHCCSLTHSLPSEDQERRNLSTYLNRQNLLKLVLLQFSVWKIAQLAVVLPGEEKAKGRWSCLSNCKIPTQFVILSAKPKYKTNQINEKWARKLYSPEQLFLNTFLMETSTSRDLGMLLECMTCVNCMNSVNDLLGVTLLKPEDEENVR